MGLLEQMAATDRLLRHPEELASLSGGEGEDAAVLRTIDPVRLAAVGDVQAGLAVSRWWQGRFAATLATLDHLLGDPAATARLLVRHPAFESADDEDQSGVAYGSAVLDAVAEGLEAPPWLGELLAYEYLLTTGLPRRARGEPVDAAFEARLLGDAATWCAGGRLKRELLVWSTRWPLEELHAEPHDAEPEPRTRVLAVEEREVVEVELPEGSADAVSLLAEGARDELVRDTLGKPGKAALRWLREAGWLKKRA